MLSSGGRPGGGEEEEEEAGEGGETGEGKQEDERKAKAMEEAGEALPRGSLKTEAEATLATTVREDRLRRKTIRGQGVGSAAPAFPRVALSCQLPRPLVH